MFISHRPGNNIQGVNGYETSSSYKVFTDGREIHAPLGGEIGWAVGRKHGTSVSFAPAVTMLWPSMTLLGFLLGSIPFSLLLGKLVLKADVREFGDGNPGAANAFRAGGLRLGLAAGVLDFLKGALPVGLARFFLNISGWELVPVAAAPLLGSAFSPFLRFRGGKSIAATFGVWTGLLMYEGPLALGLCLAFSMLLLASDAWSTVSGFALFLLYLLLRGAGMPMLFVWGINALLLAGKHASELRRLPSPRFPSRHLTRTSAGGAG